uniref:Uncharacterized protein n=1 Tax=Macrostomum lignano TaxID=282301 RepID=A0A1Y9ET46_9PLAT
MAESRAA